MSFIYTQANLESKMNSGIQGKLGILNDPQETMNTGVRELLSKVDLRSSRRKTTLAPNLYNGVFDYSCPADLKGMSIIDIPAQAQRADGEWVLAPSEDFDRNKGNSAGLVAIDDYNGSRVLRLASRVDSKTLVIAELDALNSGGGDWALFGDGENVAADDSDYVKGAGSLKFGLSSAGGTTAGIQSSNVTSHDISGYLGGTSSYFVWFKINSATNLTNMILQFGSSDSVYHEKTVTAQADGTAFVTGWNLLKFDVSSLSDTGTPDDTAITHYALYMTKTSGKISETDYKFDYLVLKKGIVHDTKYYSKYGWQNASSTYLENSTAPTDLLVADTDEYDLIARQVIIQAMDEIGYPEPAIDAKIAKLDKKIALYQQSNPSESKIMMYDSYNFI